MAAKKAAHLGLDVTKGTFKVTKGVGKGVAKGGLGLTKGVAKVGVGATTMVVGTALDGAGKVLNGANGLIFKNGQGEEDGDGYAEYYASKLESRRVGLSLVDRIANVAEASSPDKEAPEAENEAAVSARRISDASRSNVMVPTLNIGSNSKSKIWDF